jgi:hypothetical protein
MAHDFLRSRMSAGDIAEALRDGRQVSDHAFDALLPNDSRTASLRFWSPVMVAVVAARWLELYGARRVLDVGAGSGKFCTIAALATELVLDGIERRSHLVEQARGLAAALGVSDRTCFMHAELDVAMLADYDALYLYNPFCEGGYDRRQWMDESLELTPEGAREDVARVEAALDAMRVGVQVVTFHGFGGELPDTFALRRSWSFAGGTLRFWQKARAGPSERRLVEHDWV